MQRCCDERSPKGELSSSLLMHTTPPSESDESARGDYELQWCTTNKSSRYPGMGVLKKFRFLPPALPSLPVFSHSPDEVAQYTRDGVTSGISSSSSDLTAPQLRAASPEQGHSSYLNRAGSESSSLESSISADLGSVHPSNAAHVPPQGPLPPSGHAEQVSRGYSDTASVTQGSSPGPDSEFSPPLLESLWRVLIRMKTRNSATVNRLM
ncbi:hypothetical protein CPB85DRAFT_1307776 [Mucidula mucida]|nr:hypothetical protein CPB85DRAFT_1307776 [Mucidula mucida]